MTGVVALLPLPQRPILAGRGCELLRAVASDLTGEKKRWLSVPTEKKNLRRRAVLFQLFFPVFSFFLTRQRHVVSIRDLYGVGGGEPFLPLSRRLFGPVCQRYRKDDVTNLSSRER